ncbi:MAG: hypothetical protein IPO40_24785 [Fibrobacteres bacterium]|nr:hypothetical protein [Fibrobacterota bacterium]
MATINLKYQGATGAKYMRALNAFALQQGQSIDDVMEPYLRGIAQQMGIDANDTDEDQEAILSRSEGRAARIAQAHQNASQPKAKATE